MEVSTNGGTLTSMVYHGTFLLKDDLGVPLVLGNPHVYIYIYIYINMYIRVYIYILLTIGPTQSYSNVYVQDHQTVGQILTSNLEGAACLTMPCESVAKGSGL